MYILDSGISILGSSRILGSSNILMYEIYLCVCDDECENGDHDLRNYWASR